MFLRRSIRVGGKSEVEREREREREREKDARVSNDDTFHIHTERDG